MSSSISPDNRRARLQLLALALLFLLPVLAAYVFHYMPKWQPQEKTAHGELIVPARPLPAMNWLDEEGKSVSSESLKGKWSLFFLAAEQCDKACEDKLFQSRQIRLLLNENQVRLRRIYLAADVKWLGPAKAQLSAVHPDLKYLAETGEGQGARAFFQGQDPLALYVLDPLGNWMIWYPGQSGYQGILKDLKKMLRLSKIG